MCRYSLPQSPEPCVAFRHRADEDGDRQVTKGLSTTCRVDFGSIEEVLYFYVYVLYFIQFFSNICKVTTDTVRPILVKCAELTSCTSS